MLETKVGGVRVSFCFGFFAVVMFTFFAGGGGSAGIFAALLGCILHEAGHFAAMCLLDQPPERVCFYAGGIKIVPRWGLLSRRREGAILVAGCAVNFLLAWLSHMAGLREFCAVNAALGAFNMLPFAHFDGGRLAALYFKEGARRALAWVCFAGIFALAAYSGQISPAALAVLIFAAISEAAMR